MTLALAVGAGATPEGLHAAAREANLAADAAWLRLVRYRPTLLGGYESEADGASFFLSPVGKSDPSAELRATIDALFAPAEEADSHPRCRVPARARFVVERLGVDVGSLPPVSCPKLEEYVQRVGAKSVTYSFSSYYLGNPSSIFGHTFLRLNRAHRPAEGKGKELLDWGINYAGEPDTSNPFLFTLKGLFGGFKGFWSNLPYFYKVREYNDFESRDLWEYTLALRPAEVEMLVLHLWELGGTHFDYFYADENCAWHLLGALEAAAPRLELLRHVKRFVLPADTVQALFANPGLVVDVAYRPSLRAQFESRIRAFDPQTISLVRRLESEPQLPLPRFPEEQQARILDAATDYLDLLHAKRLVFESAPEAAPRRHALLVRRSKLGVIEPEPIPVPEREAPHRGHGSARMGLGGGASSARGPWASYSFRLLLHDLADPADGYPAHTIMEAALVDARFETRSHRFFVEELQLLRVGNLAPFTLFEPRATWRVQFGGHTVRDGGCDACFAGTLEGGGGISFEPAGRALLLFAFTEVQLAAGPGLNGLFGSPVRPSIGASAGVRWRVADRYTMLAQGGTWLHLESAPRTSWWLSWTHRLPLSETFALDLRLRRREDGVDVGAGALIYY